MTGSSYRRTISIGGQTGLIDVSDVAPRQSLKLQVTGVATTELFQVVQTVREMFDLDAPVAEIRKSLVRDPFLRKCLKGRSVVRVPGTWNAFELSVRAILGQQVSVKAATTLAGRLVARFGKAVTPGPGQYQNDEGLTHLFPEPHDFVRGNFDGLGITVARTSTIRSLARALVDGRLSFDTAQDPDEFLSSMTALPGIGDWTAQYVAMRALKNPDAFPASDLGLMRAFDEEEARRIKPRELLERAEAWRPWRAYAALLLWHSNANAGG